MISLNDTLKPGQAISIYFRLSAFHLPLVLSIDEMEKQAVDQLVNAGIAADRITFDNDGETIKVDLTVTDEQAGNTFGRFQQAVMNRLSTVLNTPVELVNAIETKAGQVSDSVSAGLGSLRSGIGDVTGAVTGVFKSVPLLVGIAIVGIVLIFYSGNVKAKGSV